MAHSGGRYGLGIPQFELEARADEFIVGNAVDALHPVEEFANPMLVTLEWHRTVQQGRAGEAELFIIH